MKLELNWDDSDHRFIVVTKGQAEQNKLGVFVSAHVTNCVNEKMIAILSLIGQAYQQKMSNRKS
jgi:hypothetical protein